MKKWNENLLKHLAIKEEKYAVRRAILLMLHAEEDERYVREWKKYLEEEARIMKDVPGWKVVTTREGGCLQPQESSALMFGESVNFLVIIDCLPHYE